MLLNSFTNNRKQKKLKKDAGSDDNFSSENFFLRNLYQESPSDHLPLMFTDNALKMFSWNLLADQYLGTAYYNLPIISDIDKNEQISDKHSYKSMRNAGYLFKNIGEYFFENINNNEVTISTKAILEILPNLRCLKDRKTKKIIPQKIEDASQLIEQYSESESSFLLENVRSAILMTYAIKNHFKWENRFKLIKSDTNLCDQMKACDVLCFQECTFPEGMLAFANDDLKGSYSLYKQNLFPGDSRKNDQVAVLVNDSKYEVLYQSNFGLGMIKDRKDPSKEIATKPALMLMMVEKGIENPTPIIISTLHYKGAESAAKGINEIPLINKQVELAKEEAQKKGYSQAPQIYTIGDMNFNKLFFLDKVKGSSTPNVVAPDRGTVATGKDGEIDFAIDMAFTNRKSLKVKAIDLKPGPKVELPIKINLSNQRSLKFDT